MSAFPVTRLRRLRRTGALRSLVRETRLDLEDFVMPLFVGPATEPNEALPAMGRWSVDELPKEVDRLTSSGVRAVILFGIPDEKDDEGSGAWEDDGVVQRALRPLRLTQPGQLVGVGQLPVPEEVRHLLERAARRELLHGVAAVQQRVARGVHGGDGGGVDDDAGQPLVDRRRGRLGLPGRRRVRGLGHAGLHQSRNV